MTINLNAEQIELLARMLRPHVASLTDMLIRQVRELPAGDDRWGATADALAVAHGALLALESVRRGA